MGGPDLVDASLVHGAGTRRLVPQFSSAVAMIVGGLVITGWAIGVHQLKSVAPAWPEMKLNSAVCVLLAGLSLRLLDAEPVGRGRRWAAQLCAGVVVVVGLATLCEYVVAVPLGIDAPFVGQSVSGDGALLPTRMSPVTAFALVLLGAALLSLDGRTAKGSRPAFALSLAAGVIGTIAFAGYLYGVTSFFAFPTIAFTTALCLVVLAAGILCVRSGPGRLALLTSEDLGGRVARRLLPAAIGGPLFVGWLLLLGQRAGDYGLEVGLALFATANVLMFAVLIWITAAWLNRTDEELRRTSARYRQTLDHMMEGCQVVGPDWRYLYLNEAAARHGRTTREALLGRTMTDVYPGIEKAPLFATMTHCLVDKTNARLENEFTYPDGSSGWFELSIQAVPEGLFILSIDMTERREAARKLEESEARFRQLAENIRDVFWLTDPSRNQMLYISPAYEEIWGQTRERLIASPMSWMEAVHPEDRGRVLEAAQTQDLGGYSEEYRIVRPDGSIRWIWDRAFPVVGEDGKAARIAGVAEDITERKRIADELRESERRFRGMLANLELVSVMLDRDGRIRYCNDYLLRLTGWERDDIIGRNWFDTLAPPDAPELRALFAALIADQPPAWHHENEILTLGGGRKLIRWNNSVLRSSAGEVVGTASIGEDITEQKLLEDQFRQAQKMEAVGRLAGGVAHDFNNILNVITGYGDMLLRKAPVGDPTRPRLEQILRAAERAAGLTRQLLAFSRKQVLDPKVLEPGRVLADMEKMLGRLIGEDLDLKLTLTARARVKVDPGQLEQVVMNLVVNARDAMPKGGLLTIDAADVELSQDLAHRREIVPAGRYVTLAVTDTGAGMDEKTLSRIYEPFFTTKPEGKGTGLGLATVYGIVKQSGGHIVVESEIGRGSQFRIYLPQVEDVPVKEAPAAALVNRRGTETVLLVEDDPAARELVAEVLREQGYCVLVAANGQAAVDTAAACGKAPIHLLLTDVVLPKLSGRDVAERVTALYPAVKVLYMSGYTDDAISRHGVLEPGVRLLQKPFRTEALTRSVAEVLGRA
jgi:two-component system cell cycle sensor histidine kinase/response regulator CckA